MAAPHVRLAHQADVVVTPALRSDRPFTLRGRRGKTRAVRVMFIHQAIIHLKGRPRGFHIVTQEILSALPETRHVRVGFLHLFLQHTSASLLLNENADPDVRSDLARWSDHAVPDGAPYFEHVAEGDDDMPAHAKSAVFGASLLIPIRDGRLALGTWQGIYLGEHRDHGGARSVVATLWGQKDQEGRAAE